VQLGAKVRAQLNLRIVTRVVMERLGVDGRRVIGVEMVHSAAAPAIARATILSAGPSARRP
jgi:hypothetical protein